MADKPWPVASASETQGINELLETASNERFWVRIGVPFALAAGFLLLDLFLHEVLGPAWRSVTHYLMAALLLGTSFFVVSIHQRTVAQRSAARTLLLAREESYRTLFDIFPEPTTVWSGDGVLLLQNLVSARNMGGSRETYVGKTIVEMFGPEAGLGYLERIQRVYRTGTSEQQEDEVELPTGDRRHFSTSMQRVRQPNGAHAVQVISYDITERVKAERAWRAEHERASMYLDIAAVMIVALDRDYHVTLINARGSEVLGRSESEIVGRDWFSEFLPERLREQMRSAFDRVMAGQQDIGGTFDIPVLAASGEERVIAWRIVVVRNEADEVVGALSSGEDITDRLRAEEALRNWEILRAQERTALEERQRLARELHDSVSQALYGIGLGVNTALMTLDRDMRMTREALEYALGLARAGLSEMRALILELRPESLESEGLVAALSKQVEAVRARFELPVDLRACEEPALSMSAKETLYRIAQEALHNVVRHAQARELRVALSCEDGFVILEICDDGIGFDVKEQYPGHLGLKSMRERANNLGGALRIQSAPGNGTLIEARVPIEAN